MVYKFRHRTLGGHVHIAVFVAKAPDQTFAKAGDLVLSVGQEFDQFKNQIIVDSAAVIFEAVTA